MARYPGISSEAFRHPLDRQAEAALRGVPGFELLASKFIEFFSERPQYIYNLGNYVQAGPRQYSTLYQLFRESATSLDISPEPTLFVAQNPIANSYSLGKENPYIVVYSGLLDLLNEQELQAVLAHELGHIKCEHTVLILMGIWARQIIAAVSEATFGLGQLASTGVLLAFYEWRRKAELSADRAALLVVDDLKIVQNSMMKLSGGSKQYANELSLPEFVRQSEKYQDLDQDNLNQIYKLFLYNDLSSLLSHPFPVERLHFLQEWANSVELQEIRQGNYAADPSQAVEVEQPAPTQNADLLRREIEKLQAEIDRLKGQK